MPHGLLVSPCGELFSLNNSVIFSLRSESVLLAFARKRLEQLGQELAGYQEQEQKRLEQTLKVQRDEDAKIAELKFEQEAQRMASDFAAQLKKKVGNYCTL